MVSLNVTLFVEIVLFLLFLWVVNRTVFRPLLRVMDQRGVKMAALRASAEAGRAEAERMQALYIEHLTKANQAAAERLRAARLNAYRENRLSLDELREQAEAELAGHREKLADRLDTERETYAAIVPRLLQEMDRQVRMDGSLL
ncbi:MAG TPA: ATP synthase F0 subunit B [Candidatus Hydrogenedentes bacterium]|nr:ATP synthase F0 subunit B [Candidatus Hydrogenedentota bacterium]HOS02432.1 ATP synthase F0 subunit B [Candidatus Hydrogenedentota bacterium]